MTFSIGFVQFQPVRKDIETNIKKLQQLLAGITADLIVLPELANTGYLYENTKALFPYAEPNDASGAFLQSLIALSNDTQGLIVSGYAELAKDKLFNSAIAISKEGVVANYRKIHLYADEKLLFQPGDNPFQVFTWLGVKIGMMICFDWIFPESARSLALGGAQIIAHPANLVLPYCQNAMLTRSIENQVFTITANRIGTERIPGAKLTFTGTSQMSSPVGEVLDRGPENEETVKIRNIDPHRALNKMISAQNDLFADRRPEFYT
ncbi:MAG: nitrilase-related carbon-nitrogen hydrolase [Brevefilum sp.]